MEELQEKINKRYEKNIFVNNPTLLKDEKVDVIFYKVLRQDKPLISIVTPVFNQEKIIVKNIKSVLQHTTNNLFEYILIIDACSDSTADNILSFFNSFEKYPDNCTGIIILQSDTPLFETSADNLGFYCSSGLYMLEIQADMEMTENGYNERLIKPFLHEGLKKTLIGVSGRGCHGFSLLIDNSCNKKGFGKLDNNVEKTTEELKVDRNRLYIGETCMRGPLMLNKQMLEELGFLDEKNFYLDYSDHDLFARAYYEKQWICGYLPIDFLSPLEDGSTRKPRDSKNTFWLEKRIQDSKDGNEGFLSKFLAMFYKPRSVKALKIF